ncbi:hypothetical protein EV643_107176 [Kribbella sp. VKM Ac-2527]|uniref:LPXTG-motif cell wall-anchored protein n=1 Tax=Kribbella caucasensis TaxID=2512215 RepID=A0A4R6KE58_9ACTN|nr:hypothetical protein [Kribbella sp. VKM Ac-2527]TDO48547.1 hypothetical protein EV643_107176 [Kribbella sp. VKM Ac-2527]
MSHIRSLVAGSMLAIAASSAVATQAMAGVPEESRQLPAAVVPHDPPNYPEYDSRYEVTPTVTVSADDTTSEAFQAGASALGGAALALAGAWTYRRRHHHQLHAA